MGGQGGFVDDHTCALGLDALHHALDTALPEVVAVRFHCQAVDADHALALGHGSELAVGRRIVVVTGHFQHLVGDEVLARAVALDYGRHHLLRHVGVVRQKLLGVLGQAVAAVAEGGVVVVRADARIETYALDYRLAVKSLDLGVGIELVEVAHAQGQICVGEEFLP